MTILQENCDGRFMLHDGTCGDIHGSIQSSVSLETRIPCEMWEPGYLDDGDFIYLDLNLVSGGNEFEPSYELATLSLD